jgi:hypothetical protein
MRSFDKPRFRLRNDLIEPKLSDLGGEYDGRMTAEYYPLQVLLLALSGWVNRVQSDPARTTEVCRRGGRGGRGGRLIRVLD